jgi:hypothetical protein
VAEFEARYLQYKAAAESLPRIDSEFTQLNRDYDIQKNQYASLVSRRETASMTGKLEDAGVAEFRIIDPPRVTPNPVAPNRMALLWGLIAGSLAAGFATRSAVSVIRPTFHDGRVLREIAGRPLLGMVSMIAGPGASVQASPFRTDIRGRDERTHGLLRRRVHDHLPGRWQALRIPMSLIEKAAQRLEQLRRAGVEVEPRARRPGRRAPPSAAVTERVVFRTSGVVGTCCAIRAGGSPCGCPREGCRAVEQTFGKIAHSGGAVRQSKSVEIDLAALAWRAA